MSNNKKVLGSEVTDGRLHVDGERIPLSMDEARDMKRSGSKTLSDEQFGSVIKKAVEAGSIDEERKQKGLEQILEKLHNSKSDRGKMAEDKFGNLLKSDSPSSELSK